MPTLKKVSTIFIGIIILLLLFFAKEVFAQRGEGVGALLNKSSGSASVSLSNGKTAPLAEVIVETQAGQVQAVAELDERGLFNFTFNTETGNIGALVIYAADKIGATKKITIPSSSYSNFILPPTIVSDNAGLPDDSVKLKGYSYPGAAIKLSVASDSGYGEVFSTSADISSGSWEIMLEDLSAGSYQAKAKAKSGQESEDSQEITFEIEGGAGKIITTVKQTTTKVINNVINFVSSAFEENRQKAAELVMKLPEPVIKTSDIISKVVFPFAALILVIRSGFSLAEIPTYLNYISLLGLALPIFRKKGTKWGIIYDAVTKNPLARSIVRLYDSAGGLIETDVTGKIGAFSFIVTEGIYKMVVKRPGFVFPTQIVRGTEDGEYLKIYHGETFELTKEEPLVNYNIPIDPKDYTETSRWARLKRTLSINWGKINAFIFVPSLTFSAVAYLSNDIPVNRFVVLFYLLTLLIMVIRLVFSRGRWGRVVDEKGQELAGVALSLLDSTFGRLVQRRVSDGEGKYQFFAERGKYTIIVSSEGYHLSGTKGYRGEIIEVKKESALIGPKIVVRKA